MRRRTENLEGKVFGRLTVLYQAENRNGRTAWVCACACGKETTVAAHELKNQHTKSCGCLRRENICSRRDLKDKQYGRLTALYPTSRRDQKGSVYWHCRCDCGNEVDYTESVLEHGGHKSCGCLRREIWAEMQNKCTLVDGTSIEVLKKRKHRKDNTSGFRGVTERSNRSYAVTIGFKKKRYCVGTYHDYRQAVEARLEAERLVHDGFLEAYDWWKSKAETEPAWGEANPLIYEVEKKNGRLEVRTNYVRVEEEEKEKELPFEQADAILQSVLQQCGMPASSLKEAVKRLKEQEGYREQLLTEPSAR